VRFMIDSQRNISIDKLRVVAVEILYLNSSLSARARIAGLSPYLYKKYLREARLDGSLRSAWFDFIDSKDWEKLFDQRATSLFVEQLDTANFNELEFLVKISPDSEDELCQT
jgi:hypothetical protein